MKKRESHPPSAGEILLEEFMQPSRISNEEMCYLLGEINENYFNSLLNGEKEFDSEICFKLSDIFDTTPEFWENANKYYFKWKKSIES